MNKFKTLRIKSNRVLITPLLLLLFFQMAQAQKISVSENLPVFKLTTAVQPDFVNREQLSKTFKHCEVFEISFDELRQQILNEKELELHLQFGNHVNWEMQLINEDIRGVNYKETIMKDGRLQTVSPKRSSFTYKGHLKNADEVSHIRLNVAEQFVNGYVQHNDQQIYIEPLYFTDRNASRNHYVIYRPEDVHRSGEQGCSINHMEQRYAPPEDRTGGNRNANEDCLEVDLVTACTYDFVEGFGSTSEANDRIIAITNLVQGNYDLFNIQYVIQEQFAPATLADDPFTDSVDAFDLLESMKDFAGPNLVEHDLGQIWTGRNITGCGLGSNLIGCAMSIGGVCGDFRYNLCENFWSNNSDCLRSLSAHEFGHNWGMVHDPQSTPFIMTPFIQCNATEFSENSINATFNHIATRTCLASCCEEGEECNPSGVDLKVTMTGSNEDPPLWNFHSVTITLLNEGDEDATGIVLSAPKAESSVYEGGAEYIASQGSFNTISDQTWDVGTIGAGQSATLTLAYFRISEVTFFQYAQVLSLNETDTDSTPGNGNGTSANEDDEAVYPSNEVDPCDPDITSPQIQNCPTNIVVVTEEAPVQVFWSVPTATDECGEAGLTSTAQPGWVFAEGDTEVIYTATDLSGNTSTCSFIVTVIIDDIPPPTTCIGNVLNNPSFEDNPNSIFWWEEPSGAEITNLSYAGNNALLMGSNVSGGTFQSLPASPGESYTLSGYARRTGGGTSNGNFISLKFLSSSWQPIVTEEATIQISNDYEYYEINQVAPANAAYVEVKIFKVAGDFEVYADEFCLTTNTNDPCNPDITAPVFTNCPITDVFVSTTSAPTPVSFTTPIAIDNCGNVDLDANYQSGDLFPEGLTVVQYIAVDESGNEAFCSFNVIVTVDPVDEEGCYFEEVYEEVPSNVSFRSIRAKEETDGSFVLQTFDQDAAFGLSTSLVNVSENGTYEDYNYLGSLPYPLGAIDDGYLNASNNGNGDFSLERFLFGGTSQWVQNYSIPGVSNFTFSSASQVDDTYIITGIVNKNNEPDNQFYPFFFQVDLEGNGITYSIGGLLSGFASISFASKSNTGYFLRAYYPTSISSSVMKTNFQGDVLWETNFPNGEASSLRNVSEAMDGSIYVSILGGAPTVPFAPLSVGNFYKLNSNGDQEWNRTISFPESSIALPSILAVNDGAVISYVLRENGVSSFKYQKVSPGNAILWGYTYGNNDASIQLQTQDGGLLFAGIKETGLGQGSYTAEPYLLKTTSEGNLLPPCDSTPVEQADLILGDLNAPALIMAGEVIEYTFSLSNIGTADASNNFSIKAYFSTDASLSADDIFDGIVPTGNVGAGVTIPNVTGASTVPNLAPGQYYLILKVDADDEIMESNEANNTIVSLLTIESEEPTDFPDLTISDIILPEAVFTGAAFQYQYTISNEGTVASPSTYIIKVYLSTDESVDNNDILLESILASTIQPGQVFQFTGTELLPNVDLGDYFIIMVIDANNEVVESNENNNQAASSFSVIGDIPPGEYCEVTSAFPWHEWISNVKLNDFENPSGKSVYSDFTDLGPVVVEQGGALAFEFTATFSYFTYNEFLYYYIDWNNNGVFEESETGGAFFNPIPPGNGVTIQSIGTVTVPTTTSPGTKRIRIILSREAPVTCGEIAFGEIEDYEIEVVPAGGMQAQLRTFDPTEIIVYPNPVHNELTLEFRSDLPAQTVQVLDVYGQVKYTQDVDQRQSGDAYRRININTSDWINGAYFIQLTGPFKTRTKRVMVQRTY